MTGKATAFMKSFGNNVAEDVASSRNILPATASPVVGRTRMKNAARIKLEVIDVDPQHREEFDEEGIARLAESLKEHGQLQPIRVRFDADRKRYVLIAGERRLRAMKHAGWDEADCVIADGDLSESDILTQQILENLQREDLRPVERARAFADLMTKNGWDQTTLAAELCVTQGTVSNALKLLKLDEDTQAKVDAGEVKATIAISAARTSRKPAGKKSRKPKPLNFRTSSGKAVVEPKMGKSYVAVLQEALDAAIAAEQKAA